MNARSEALDWLGANQRHLVAQFALLKARLAARAGGDGDGGAELAAAEADCAQAARALPQPAASDTVARCFGLSAFERDLLLLAAGCEMDAALAAACAGAAGHAAPGHASFGLALAVLPDAHWSALAPAAPLRRWRLVEAADDAGIAHARLRIDERVLHYLAGIDTPDPRLAPLLRTLPVPTLPAAGQGALAGAIAALLIDALEHDAGAPPCLQLAGADLAGQRDVAARAAHHLGLPVLALSAADLPASAADRHALALLLEREALLAPCAWLVEVGEGDRAAALPFVERLRGCVFVAAREPLPLVRDNRRWPVELPEPTEQRALWRSALGAHAASGAERERQLDAVASQFRLSAQTIAAVAAQAGPGTDLWQACRALVRPRLDDLAQRVEPRAGWDDLVLPEAQRALLRQLLAHVRHRLRVHDEWGFAAKSARGLGVSALFAGESGTGKTMAAEVLARELGLDLYRIDLAAVVSKYIGETEKNLKRVFDAAEDGGAVLLFDEADALFGKRSEVKDSHDRYANIEVGYLLQRMEAYRGLAILTTNLKGALDPAFQRRLRFVVHFPFPDERQREAIWRSVLPAALPRAALDERRLAQLHMAGGGIRNVALNAAFIAAERDEPLAMAHLLQAAHAEAGKRERPLAEAETRGWV
jgi:hypothetical protein